MLKFVRCTTIQHVKFFFATQTKINQFALNLSIDTTLIRGFLLFTVQTFHPWTLCTWKCCIFKALL